MSPPRVPLIYGAAKLTTNSQTPGPEQLDGAASQALLDCFVKKSGYKELDSARIYGNGASEEALGKLETYDARIDTKIFPLAGGDHAPAKLRATLQLSLAALGKKKIRTLYLHAPDRHTPYEETLSEIDKFHKEGLIEAFGLSNYWAWEVSQIVTICKYKGYIFPTIYQGPYSILQRTNEVELFPVLRKFGIRFVAYSPLAGGLLKGNPTRPGGRYDPNTSFGPFQIKLYTAGRQYEALEMLKEVGDKHKLSLGEIALRWLQHHSKLTPQDGVIFGSSSVAQMEENIKELEKGPLPEEVVQAVEKVNVIVAGIPTPYAAGLGTDYGLPLKTDSEEKK